MSLFFTFFVNPSPTFLNGSRPVTHSQPILPNCFFYTFPKKPIPQMKKSFCVCFEEPITWPNPKKFLIFFEEKNTLEENILLYFLVKITTLIRKKKHIFQTQLTSCNYQKKHFSNKEFLTLA